MKSITQKIIREKNKGIDFQKNQGDHFFQVFETCQVFISQNIYLNSYRGVSRLGNSKKPSRFLKPSRFRDVLYSIYARVQYIRLVRK
jgi:hypothetical protein